MENVEVKIVRWYWSSDEVNEMRMIVVGNMKENGGAKGQLLYI